MPITTSAKKALRQSIKRKAENLTIKNSLKELLKKAQVLVSQKKTQEAKTLLPKVYKALDKATKIGILKKNTASRRKSRFARLLLKVAQ